MKQACITAVTQAAGRSLTQAELQDIENRVRKNQRLLASLDNKKYTAMTPDQQLHEAAKLAAQELIAEKMKKKQRIALTIKAHDAIENYTAQQKTRYNMSGLDSLRRVLAFFSDGKSNFQSVESRGHAIWADYARNLVETFESVQPRILGLFANREGIKALTWELFGQDSSRIVDAETASAAKAAAKAWGEQSELARQHYNAAGGQIGKLDDWHMPQHHSQKLVALAGRAQWLKDIYGKLDLKRYTNEDGTYMTQSQVMDFLSNAWESIATGGANKIEPGKQAGIGMRANRGAEERMIHFKDADSYLEYQKKYGGIDAFTVMMKHMHSIAGEIALLEKMGPNPDLAFKYFSEKAMKDDTLQNPKKAGSIRYNVSRTQDLYDSISGKTKPVANWKIAQGFDTLRNWLVATRLGSAFVTSITDNATMQLTASVNNMSHLQLLRNQLTTLNPKNREELRMARRAGLSLNTFLGEMNRWGSEALGPSFSSKMANLTIRASLLNAATEARRRAFGVTMYGSIGNTVASHDFASLDKTDKRLLESKGVTDTDYNVWKEAQLEDWGNGNDNMLTPESIYRIPDAQLAKYGEPATVRREAALKLLGMVNEEVNMAVIEPGARERALTKMGTTPGTWKGEITRSFFLFKSFPLALIMRHWARGFGQETAGGKAAYLAALLAGTTVMGAVAQQISNLIAGRDPQDMFGDHKGRFLAASLMKGGSLGIYGDFLLSTNTSYGNTPLAVLSGPVAGYIEDIVGLTQGNLVQYAQGKKTNAAAELIHLIKTNLPLQNLWYTKAMTDRLIFNQLQEMVNPGYMSRIEQRARREFGQSHYWRPGSIAPDRGPDFGKAIGQ